MAALRHTPTGHAFVQNLRRRHYEIANDPPAQHRLTAPLLHLSREILRASARPTAHPRLVTVTGARTRVARRAMKRRTNDDDRHSDGGERTTDARRREHCSDISTEDMAEEDGQRPGEEPRQSSASASRGCAGGHGVAGRNGPPRGWSPTRRLWRMSRSRTAFPALTAGAPGKAVQPNGVRGRVRLAIPAR